MVILSEGLMVVVGVKVLRSISSDTVETERESGSALGNRHGVPHAAGGWAGGSAKAKCKPLVHVCW